MSASEIHLVTLSPHTVRELIPTPLSLHRVAACFIETAQVCLLEQPGALFLYTYGPLVPNFCPVSPKVSLPAILTGPFLLNRASGLLPSCCCLLET